MDWFKKHVDTVIVLTGIFSSMVSMISSMVWMNGKFYHLQEQINDVKEQVVVMKTVLILKNIMPIEPAKRVEE